MNGLSQKRKSYAGRDALLYTTVGDRKALEMDSSDSDATDDDSESGPGQVEGTVEVDGDESDEDEDEEDDAEDDDSVLEGLNDVDQTTLKPAVNEPPDSAPEDEIEWKPTPAAAALPRVSRIPQHALTTKAPPAIPFPSTFESLRVSAALIRALTSMSIKKPTEIQSACVPPMLRGEDVIGNAKTGSGKTIAFALPILHQLSLDPYGIFALVLTPTRELAFQIADQFNVLGAPLNARTAVVVGGMDMMAQAAELCSRPHIVVATPGRLVDLMRSGSGEWSLGRVRFLVLDEADRLLTPTFASDLAELFAAMPSDRQTGLFTATLTPAIEALAEATPRPGKKKPFIHRVLSDTETVETLKQHYLLCPPHVRELYLYYLLCNPPESIVHLRREPPPAKGSKRSSKKPKKASEEDDTPLPPPPTIIFRQRMNSLGLFRSRTIPILVATDVASRGLDIEDVALVVNWDMPGEGHEEEYVHRVGRTARAGRGGVAVSFVGGEEGGDAVRRIESRIKTHLTELVLPEEKVLEHLNLVSTAKRLANMELHDSKFGEREAIRRQKRARLEKA
ncbi:DEAD-domain-containing protein [Calocera viscosa TUFC12733]|uniref:DEAD-domain-containing protein n=1 Tax=Calocera viscosa (strain TUFC12733) TaxID=1330018 RepID=A0A167QSS9_CALVF|nr:DEAD-domain-containing protein [Calocera viscosa TUFC12733]